MFVGFLFALVTSGQAFGMGDNPSTCDNRYDGSITSLVITNGEQTYDPIANPGLTFEIENNKSYNVTLVIHTPDQSSNGNSLDGTTWYHTSALGYWMGFCVDSAGPNQDVVLVLPQEHSGSIAPQTTQDVSWATLGSDEITYNVRWVNPVDSSAAPDAPTSLVAKSASSSKIRLSWSTPANDGGSQITGYRIDRSTDDGSSWSAIANTASNATKYVDSKLGQNTKYTYRVAATNSVGMGDYSNNASATTASNQQVGKILLKIPGSVARELHISLNH